MIVSDIRDKLDVLVRQVDRDYGHKDWTKFKTVLIQRLSVHEHGLITDAESRGVEVERARVKTHLQKVLDEFLPTTL